MSIRLLPLTFAVVMQMMLAPQSHASDRKVGYAYTIEWLISDADVVVHATLADTEPSQVGYWTVAKAKVEETLKGGPGGEILFAVRGTPARLARFRGRQVLMILDHAGRHSQQNSPPIGSDLVLNPDRSDWSIIDLAGGPNDFVVTMALDVLDAPKEILAAARESAEYSRGRTKPNPYLIKGVPGGSELYERIGGLTLPGIFLPRDSRLDARARDLTKSKNPYCRLEGITILGQHRSDENIAAVSALLADPAVIGGRYLVRESSKIRLSRWGIEVDGIKP